MKWVQLAAVATLLCVSLPSVAHGDDTQNVSSNKLDGNYLLRMGTKYDKPLLRLLGKTIANIEKEIKCASGGCGQWSEWSSCSVMDLGQFGMQERNRQCRLNMTTCERLANNKIETDYKVCEGDKPETKPKERKCPESYNITTHGFCLRFVSSYGIKATAKSVCQADDGYVVNVNSIEKLEDVTKLARNNGETNNLWIDGERSSPKSPWTFSYETQLTWSPEWASGDPDNGPSDLCLRLSMDKKKWDGFCTSSVYSFICEVVP